MGGGGGGGGRKTDQLVTHLHPLTSRSSNACQLPSREETLIPLWEVLGAMTRHSCMRHLWSRVCVSPLFECFWFWRLKIVMHKLANATSLPCRKRANSTSVHAPMQPPSHALSCRHQVNNKHNCIMRRAN